MLCSIQAGVLRVAYFDQGPANGSVVVLLHVENSRGMIPKLHKK